MVLLMPRRRGIVITETIFENRFMHVPELAAWAPTSTSTGAPR